MKIIESFSGWLGYAKIAKNSNDLSLAITERMEEKPLLTLGILAGGGMNDLDDLKDCLQRNGFLADEIIVVTNDELDTNKTNGILDLAADYGARQVHIDTNNFSSLRNAIVKRARGEWVLMLDIDEDFRDPTFSIREILKKADTDTLAYFINIDSPTKINGQMQPADVKPYLRMFRAKEQFRYTGWVHEDILPSILEYEDVNKNQILTLDPKLIQIHHYGYGIEEMRDHRDKRNTKIMETEILQDPKPTPFLFLALHYYQSGNLQDAKKYIQQGMLICENKEFAKSKHVKAQIFSLGALVTFQLAEILDDSQQYQEAGYMAEQALDIAGFLKLPKWIEAQCFEYFKKYKRASDLYLMILNERDIPTSEFRAIDYKEVYASFTKCRQLLGLITETR
jgi:tetratricopeptide (TPR) repeat protein